MHALVGQKQEQIQKFRTDGKRIPVTVVEIDKNVVIAVKTQDRDGYWAVQLGYGTKKHPSKPLLGHIKGAKTEKAPQFLKEVRVLDAKSADELPKVGDFISVSEVFEPGDVIDVTGVSKGKGFAGGVKRYHFRGGPATHGQSDRHRAPGSIGAGTTPGRVYKGKRMAGKMGFEMVTVKNLTVAGIDGNLLYIEGLIPGKLGALVTVKKVGGKDKNFVDLVEGAAAQKEKSSSEIELPLEEKAEEVQQPAQVGEVAQVEEKIEVKEEEVVEQKEETKKEEEAK